MKKLFFLLTTLTLVYSNSVFAIKTHPNDILQIIPGAERHLDRITTINNSPSVAPTSKKTAVKKEKVTHHHKKKHTKHIKKTKHKKTVTKKHKTTHHKKHHKKRS